MPRVIALIGTTKGAFLLESNAERRNWTVKGPFCDNWPMLHVNYDPASRSIFAVGGNSWYGAAVWRSRDFGDTWTHSSQGLTYGEGGPDLIKLWNVTPANGSVYVGAEPAGLFRSDDGGDTWTHVAGLRNHPTRPNWQAGGGGLCLHTIAPHPSDAQKMWVAASSVGTFFTEDGGATWVTQNKGLVSDYMPPDAKPEVGWCVHKMVVAPGNPNLLYQQNHQNVYRSDDAGQSWVIINEGLPSTFGFPIAVHPHDPNTIYTVPLSGDSKGRYMPDGQAAVWRSRNQGRTWEKLTNGLPAANAYVGVLRHGMTTDTLPSAGIYFGTSTGQLFVSPDGGDHWHLAADFLPSISGVEVAVVED